MVVIVKHLSYQLIAGDALLECPLLGLGLCKILRGDLRLSIQHLSLLYATDAVQGKVSNQYGLALVLLKHGWLQCQVTFYVNIKCLESNFYSFDSGL